jgi:hypothetical protein
MNRGSHAVELHTDRCAAVAQHLGSLQGQVKPIRESNVVYPEFVAGVEGAEVLLTDARYERLSHRTAYN